MRLFSRLCRSDDRPGAVDSLATGNHTVTNTIAVTDAHGFAATNSEIYFTPVCHSRAARWLERFGARRENPRPSTDESIQFVQRQVFSGIAYRRSQRPVWLEHFVQ